MIMNKYQFLALMVIMAMLGCSKEKVIYRELGGEWEITKAEITYYTNWNVDSVAVFEDVGTITLFEDNVSDPSNNYSRCLLESTSDYVPWGMSSQIHLSIQSPECYWASDRYDRERITFWNSTGIFSSTLHVVYNRIKNANGPGRREQWMYIDGVRKEVLYVKLKDAHPNKW